jgi:hypothetical protein
MSTLPETTWMAGRVPGAGAIIAPARAFGVSADVLLGLKPLGHVE